MKRIFYGLSGEGLGHASRTLAVMDRMPDVEFHIFTYGQAYDFFQSVGHPHLYKIDGLNFSYTNGQVNYLRTAYRAAIYIAEGLKSNVDLIKEASAELKPDLFISDFEPSIPRAALELKQNAISLDNQHRFAYVDMIDLPLFLRMYGWVCGLTARIFVPRPKHTIISTFHFDHINPKGKNVALANGLLRRTVEETPRTDEGHLLVYTRSSVASKMLNSLIDIRDMPVKVYGAKDQDIVGWLKENRPNFEFLPPSVEFVKHLASCNALYCTAGNQLITEARYYKKRCLVVPEPKQYEQHINSFYVEKLGIGIKACAHELKPRLVESFLTNFQNTAEPAPNGVNTVEEVIRSYL